MTYEITWMRDSDALTPEQEVDATMRQDAVETILEQENIDLGDVTYKHPPRLLTADAQPFFTVCSFVLDNIETFIIYQFLNEDEQNKIVLSEEAIELLERLREEDELGETKEVSKEK